MSATSEAQSKLPFYLVNAFTTNSPHSGNQAAVVILPSDHSLQKDDDRKQLIARDFGFAETSYVVPHKDGTYGLRWWTPGQEVVLCGHATLAAAAVLFSLDSAKKSITFQTRWAGDLIATRAVEAASKPSGSSGFGVEITLPSLSNIILSSLTDTSTHSHYENISKIFAEAANIRTSEIKRAYLVPWAEGQFSSIIELEPEVDLAGLKVDAKAVGKVSGGMNIVTQIKEGECSEGKLGIHTRVFAPGVGVDEDPVTGSAHAYLTGYYLGTPLFSRLPKCVTETRKPEDVLIDAKQVSSRGGALKCRWDAGKAKVAGTGFIWGSGKLDL